MRMRKKHNMPQRIEKCAAIHITNPEEYRTRWLQRVPGFRELQLEIGCGRGKFTTEAAVRMPETLLVAIERVPEAMIVGMERADREGIRNIRFVNTDATNLLNIFGPGEVSRIYLNFCDPWPNNGHKKRRLTHENFIKIYGLILKSGGEIHFKTDNDDLFEFSLGQLMTNGFELSEITQDLHKNGPVGIMTDYEQKFYEQGVLINRCVARLRV